MKPPRSLLLAVAACAAALGVAAPAAHAAPPPNDNFADATAVQLPSKTPGTTVDATKEADEPAHLSGTKAVWFTFTPAEDGAVQLDACTTEADTTMTVYTGTELKALRREASDDDTCGGVGPRVTLQVKANTKYSIAMTGYQDIGSTFTLNVQQLRQPENDAFADATRITRAGRFTGSATLATREFGEPRLKSSVQGHTVWFRYRSRRTQKVTLDTIGSNYDTVLGVFRGDLGRLKRVKVDDDGGPSTASQLSFTARRGRTYHIVIDGLGTSGDYELGLSDGSAAGVGLEVEPTEGQSLDSAITSGLRAKLSCARPCRVVLRALVSASDAQRMNLDSRTVAQIAGRLGGDDRELPAVLRLSRRARAAFEAEDQVTVTVRATLQRTSHPDRSVGQQLTLRRLPPER